MAHDDRCQTDRDRERERGRGPELRGNDSFGGGRGNQAARPHRRGDRPEHLHVAPPRDRDER